MSSGLCNRAKAMYVGITGVALYSLATEVNAVLEARLLRWHNQLAEYSQQQLAQRQAQHGAECGAQQQAWQQSYECE